MEITYREAEPREAAALLEYMKQVGSESGNLSFGAEGLSFSVEQEAAILESICQNPRSIMLLAFDGGEIVGNAASTEAADPGSPTGMSWPLPSGKAIGAGASAPP